MVHNKVYNGVLIVNIILMINTAEEFNTVLQDYQLQSGQGKKGNYALPSGKGFSHAAWKFER